MGFTLDATPLELLLGAVLLLFVYYVYASSNYAYWKIRSIPYAKPSFPFGTDKDLLFYRQALGIFYESIYHRFKKEKVVGMFDLSEPYLLIKDPELLRQIMTKDFKHFIDRGLLNPDHWHPVNRHLFSMNGEPWKIMRQKLTPAFTSGKLKMMYSMMEACCDEFIKALDVVAQNNETFPPKHLVACLTTDVIASCVFGLQSNSIKNPENEFRKNGNQLVGELPTVTVIKERIGKSFPQLFTKLPIGLLTNGTENFFLKLVGDTIGFREKNGVVRNDFIDILMKLKNNKSLNEERNGNSKLLKDTSNNEPALTLEDMAAQALLFFAAGFETTSSIISFCLYEIALNPDVQEKMRKEADEIFNKNSGKLNYQSLQDMPYMEAVINETMRRYASLPILNRTCTSDYKVPDMNLVIPKGMKIVIPTYAIHHDPDYYPDPYKFDPERFTDGKIDTKSNYTFMPFGEGPRMCIGNRFAMIQMKMCLAMIVCTFELSTCKETQIPVTISKKTIGTTAEKPIILRISRRRH